MVRESRTRMKTKMNKFLLPAIMSILVAIALPFTARTEVKVRIDSAVLYKDKLIVEYQIVNFSSDYMEMIVPEHFQSLEGKSISWSLPFRTLDSVDTRINLFSDVAHCAPPSESPRGFIYGVKQLKQGSHSEKIVLQTPIKENFPFFKRGRIEKFWNPNYGFWEIIKFWEFMQTSIDLDDRNYLELENDWINIIDYDKVLRMKEGKAEIIDMGKVTSIKLTIGMVEDHGLRLDRELVYMSACGQDIKKHMFYVTAEKEITRAD